MSGSPLSRSSLIPKSVQDYLLWYHFGSPSNERVSGSQEIMNTFCKFYRGIQMNPHNLSLFIDSFIQRPDLRIVRDEDPRKTVIKCQTVIIVGGLSPEMRIEESVNTNARFSPINTTWMKISSSGMVLEEVPQKVAQAFRLHLQGAGFTLKAYERKRALMAGASLPCLTSNNLAFLSRRLTSLELDI